MKISAEPIENSQVALNIEMEPVEVDESLAQAYSRLVQKVSVPGFRKGKAPRDVLEHHIGKEALFQEALERLIPKACMEAIEEQDIDAIARPEVEIIQTEPLIFKAIVPVRPTVKLGDYKEIRVESKAVEVGDKEVDDTIEYLRHQHSMLVPVDRPAQLGDVVVIDIGGKVQGESFLIRKDMAYGLDKDAKLPLPGFAEKLEGVEKGEERDFVLAYPSDYEIEELAGKEYSFEVKATEIKEKQMPEVDDEFAKSVGSEDVASLREQMAANLRTRAEGKARSDFENEAISIAVEISEVEYPSALVDSEIDRSLSEEASHFNDGIKGLENYLTNINKTFEGHREELRPMAEQRIVRSLVMEEIAKAEGIEVSASDIDDEIDKAVKDAGEREEEMRKFFSLPQSRDSIERMILGRKTVELLVQIASGSA